MLSASRTQLLHEPPPLLPSDRDSDFDPPPIWANFSTMSSARENLKSLFTHALHEPRDTPHKEARRNSINSSEVEDSPQIDHVIQERSRDKGKRMSFSNKELESSFVTAVVHYPHSDLEDPRHGATQQYQQRWPNNGSGW